MFIFFIISVQNTIMRMLIIYSCINLNMSKFDYAKNKSSIKYKLSRKLDAFELKIWNVTALQMMSPIYGSSHGASSRSKKKHSRKKYLQKNFRNFILTYLSGSKYNFFLNFSEKKNKKKKNLQRKLSKLHFYLFIGVQIQKVFVKLFTKKIHLRKNICKKTFEI